MLDEMTIRPDELEIKINEIEKEIEKWNTFYKKCLNKLVGEIKSLSPKSIFILDRSARPVAWMLKGYWQGLIEAGKISKESKFPEIRFISVDTDIIPSDLAIEEARKRYSINKNGPILVVDEFSESGRTKRLGKETLKRVFPGVEVFETDLFGSWFPEFKRQSYLFGRALYGISDSQEDTIISEAVNFDLSFFSQRSKYHKIFSDFGKRCAI